MLKLLELNRDCVSGVLDTMGVIYAVNRLAGCRPDRSAAGRRGVVSEFVACRLA
ncbi:MAG: hypothetical protein ACRDPR_12810 [Nocardioidaceae bacterium]